MKTTRISNQGLPIRLKSLKFSSQIAIIVLGLMLACEKEDQKPQPQVIQFTSNGLFLIEGNSSTISLVLGSPAAISGSVDIFLGGDAIYGQHYTTDPAAATGNFLKLTISAGQRVVQFQVFTSDDNVENLDRTLELTLERPTSGFSLGVSRLLMTIRDNEGTVPGLPPLSQIYANIGPQRISIAETESSGMVVRVYLSQLVEDLFDHVSVPATAIGTVTIKFASVHASYGKEFYTVPEATGDSLVISFNGTQTDTTFTFIPIDNGDFKGSRFVSMEVLSATGAIQSSNSHYWLEIEDDEAGPNQVKWTKLENTPLSGSLSAKFHDENNGYIWRENKFYKTTDGGLHWDELEIDKPYSQIIPFFIDDQIGFVSALEYDCVYDNDFDGYTCVVKTIISKTINGGDDWTPLKELDLTASTLYFISKSIGFIGTTDGMIVKTADGGETWKVAYGPGHGSPPSDFVFMDDGTGYVRSDDTILKTVDSGDSWIASFSAPKGSSGITSLSRSSSNSLYALLQDCRNLPDGFRTIYKSNDGTNWTLANECILAERLSLLSAGNLGVSIGGLLHDEWQSDVHLTLDNGSSWNLQSIPYDAGRLWSVAIASDHVFYIFGDDGALLKGEIE